MKGSPGKSPAVQWYFKDWLGDKNLQITSASTRGIWINLLMYMSDYSVSDDSEFGICAPGVFFGDLRNLAALGHATDKEAQKFLLEATKYRFCDVKRSINGTIIDHSEMVKMVGSPGDVCIMSRRIVREAEKRARWREDKRKQRDEKMDNGHCPSNVQPLKPIPPIPSPIPSSIPTSKNGLFLKKLKALEMDQIKTMSRIMVEEHISELICQFRDDGIWQNVRSFVTQSLRAGKNRRAVLHALIKTYLKDSFNRGPWAYANHILDVENGNYNESDNERKYK